MDEKIKKEFEELKNLETEGSLNDDQQARFEELKIQNEAEKTDNKSTEKTDNKSKEFQTLDAQKRHWREEAIDPKTGKKYKVLYQELKEPKPETKQTQTEDAELWKAKVDFLIQSQGKNYSDEEFDHIATVAARKGVSLPEAANSEGDYIKFQRDKVAEKNKVPAPGSASATSSVEKSPAEITKMLAGKSSQEKSSIMRDYEEKVRKAEQGQGV